MTAHTTNKTLCLLALLAGSTLSQGASAGGWFWSQPSTDSGVISPRVVAGALRTQNTRLVEAPVRRGTLVTALGRDSHGNFVRFTLDGRDGAILDARNLGGDVQVSGPRRDEDDFQYAPQSDEAPREAEETRKTQEAPEARSKEANGLQAWCTTAGIGSHERSKLRRTSRTV